MNPTPNITNNTDGLLQQWGQSHRGLPLRNEAMKSEMLARLPLTAPSPERERTSAYRLPWLPLLLTGMAVFAFILSAGPQRIASPIAYLEKSLSSADSRQYQNDSELKMSEPNLGLSLFNDVAYPQSDPVAGETPATDNREFLKTGYNADIKTRHVQELASRLQTTVRGFGGRIDSASSSPQSGFLSFVVPADKFEAFRSEVKSLAGARFYTEQTTSQNLLSQKRSIEEQQKSVQENLSQLGVTRDQLIAGHNGTVATLQAQIDVAAKQLTAVQTEIANHSERKAELEPQRQQLQAQINALKNRLNIENTNYQGQLNSLDSQIQNANALLKNLDTQTDALLDNVATVSGTISLSRISWWGILTLYVPGYWISLALLALAITVYFIQRRQSRWTI